MGFLIEDGGGSGTKAKVDAEGRLLGNAIAVGPLEHASQIDGNAAFWYTTFATGGADVEVISIENTEGKRKLSLTRVFLSSSVDTTWTVFEVTSGTPAGTPLTYLNPNLVSGVTNDNTAFGNASVTGGLTGNNIIGLQTLANKTREFFFEGSIVLGNSDTVAITASTDGTVHVTVVGFWAD